VCRLAARRDSEALVAGRDALTPALLVFFVIGTIAVASSILVIGMRNPVHSALFLLLTFLCVAVLFVMQSAEFVAAVQVLVYAGGIMVLFLFVVMLINVRHLPDERVLSRFWKGGFAVGGAIVIGKRELTAIEEETGPAFILDRVETEKDVKEAMSA